MPITVVNNNSLVSALQQTNPITINLPSAVDMSSVALQAAESAQVAQVGAEAAQVGAEAARDAAQRAAFTLPTWADLSAITGSTAGDGAEVLDADAGTHTDPVVGGTVANAGRYTWSASPAGWKWIGGTGLSSKLSKHHNLSDVDDTTAARLNIGAADAQDVVAISDRIGGFFEALETVNGQIADMSVLTNTGVYNAKSYVIGADAGTLTQLSAYCPPGNGGVPAKVVVGTVSGTTVTLTESTDVTVADGFNTFSVNMTVPDNGVVGLQTNGATLVLGTNTGLPSITLWYSNAYTQTFSGTLLNGKLMMTATTEKLVDALTPKLTDLYSFVETVVEKMIAGIDFAGDETTTTATGKNLMLLPNEVVVGDGTITSVEIVQPDTSVGTKYLLVFDFDGVDTYTRVGSYPIVVSAGYNNIPLNIPVTDGQVIGLGGTIGTSTTNAAPRRTLYANSGTQLVDGVAAVGSYSWYINVNISRRQIRASGTTAARKVARVIELGGQSNADGQNSTAVNLSSYGNLMYSTGLRTMYTAPNRTMLAPIMEATRTTGLNIATAYATELNMARSGTTLWSDLDSVFFASSGAFGGQTIENIFDFSGTIWPNMASDIRVASGLLRDNGYDPVFSHYLWVQGYSNRADARGVYAPKIRAGIARVRGAAGHNMPGVPFFIGAQMPHHKQSDPTNNPNVALDLRDVAIEVGGEIFPLYAAEWADGGIHMTTKGNVYKGLMLGKMIADLDAGSFRHVHFKVNTWGSSSVVLDIIGGVGAYAFDTDTIAVAPNMGFDAYDAAGNLLSGVVTGASITGTRVTLTTTRSIASGERIAYGWGRPEMPIPSDASPGPYRLGNLRDTDTRSRVVSGVTYNLWNWAVIQDVVRL